KLPVWGSELWIAERIAEGNEVVILPRSECGPEVVYAAYFNRIQKRFPTVLFAVDDEAAYEAGSVTNRAEAEAELIPLREAVEVVQNRQMRTGRVSKPLVGVGHGLHEVMGAYIADLDVRLLAPPDPNSEERELRPSAGTYKENCKTLKGLFVDCAMSA